jgi:hypothetical protein
MEKDEDLTLKIDPSRPGVAMIVGGDEFAGMLLGMRARRIVACVNACRGISTELLEHSNHEGMLALAEKAHKALAAY